MDRPELYSGLEVVEPVSYYAPNPVGETNKETVPGESPHPRKRVWPIAATVVVVLLLIGGIVGGVVGGLKSRHHHNSGPTT
jgi:hypothetical protein